MPALEIRPFAVGHDSFDELAALWTALHPDMPRSGEVWAARHAQSQHKPSVGLFVARRDGAVVGLAQHDPCEVAGEPGQVQVAFAVRPEVEGGAALEALYARLMEAIAPLDPPSLVAYANEGHPWMVAFFQRHGFEIAQRTASSRLLVSAFDAKAFAPLLERVARDGYELLSVTELAEADPDWMHSYHALDLAIMRDIPFLGPVRERTFEAFCEQIRDPNAWNPDATFVARHVATGELVGAALIATYATIPGYGFAGLTGVRREHRRRGIACALKVATIAWARTQGVTRIVTLNEVNNPMLQLNLALGFETQHVQLTLHKRM